MKLRGFTESEPGWEGDDNNPNRIWTSEVLDGATSIALPFDPHILTAGQHYYWGVELIANGQVFRESASFLAEPIATNAPYNGVTLITHGFDLSVTEGDVPFQQPAQFMALAAMIAEASGGGVVLSYNRVTGEWVDRKTGAVGAAALQAGKAVVLVADWSKESDISDSGFSEAAADAMFASLLSLDRDTGNNLLNSPLHLIGHSRGTVVNSEIVQRLGWWLPELTDVHMTTLDPHDFGQDSLEVPIESAIDWAQFGINAAILASVLLGPAAPAVIANLTLLKNALGGITTLAEAFGIALDIPYDDFKDPDVQRWENIGFLDNYFQTAASSDSFTMTPNGRDIANADFSVWLNPLGGFTQDDFLAFGLGGPHSRVWQWYAGTAATDMLRFGDDPLFRRIVDEGISTRAVGVPAFEFNAVPWYWSVPGRAPSDLTSTEPWNLAGAIWEGITTGWYFSAAGGGVSERPSSQAEPVPVAEDNTEVTRAGVAVPSVFNGNFEYGTRQSLLNRLLPGADTYRFPLSYELPGWSFHGGQGFTLGFPAVGELDIAGLFVMETNVGALASGALRILWEAIADATVGALANKAKADFVGGEPEEPDDDSSPGYRSWYDQNWGPTGMMRVLNDYSEALWELVAKVLEEMADAGLGALDLEEAIQIDEDHVHPLGAEAFKEYISAGLGELFKKAFGDGSNYALLMGASSTLSDVIQTLFPSGLDDLLQGVLDQIVNLDTITHNRLAVPDDQPQLAFDVIAPLMVLPGAKLKVRFLATDLDPTLQDSPWQTVELDVSFFSRKTYFVQVPDSFKGATALLQFSFEAMDGSTKVSFDENDALFVDQIPLLGQLFFLDNIRFSQGLEATITSPVPEDNRATLAVEFSPFDVQRESHITIDWGDGSAIENRTLAPGAGSVSLTHDYPDDDPSGTPADRKRVVVTSDNALGASTATVWVDVLNTAPAIVQLELDSIEVEEGEELRLVGTFVDSGLIDTYTLTIDWGDGRTPTEDQDVMQTAPDGDGTFTRFYRYEDDNPTLTSQDSYTITVTLEDDDTGKNTRTINVLVKNVAPVIEEATLDVSRVAEGETAELTVRYSDRGVTDVLTMYVDWPDGETTVHTLAMDPDGVGSITVPHLLEDDDPTGTPEDAGQVHIRIEDDDGGSVAQDVALTVENVAPTVTAVMLTPVVNEGDSAELQVDIDDPGVDDTWKVFVDWGDGGPEEMFVGTRGSQTFAHGYADDDPTGTPADSYNVTIRVEDDDTGDATASASVQVQNLPPTATIARDMAVGLLEEFQLTGYLEDPGLLDTHDWHWLIADANDVVIASSSDEEPSFQLTVEGQYTASLVITDDDGGTSVADTSIILVGTGVSWSIAAAPETNVEGDTVTLEVEVVGVSTDDEYTLDIDFGDGTVLSDVAVPASGGSGVTTLDFDHAYADDQAPGLADEYEISVRLVFHSDPYSAEVGTKSVLVEVGNADPVVSIAVTPPTVAGGAHQLDGSFTDPGTGDTHTLVWDLGDGTLLTGSAIVNHVFAQPAMVTLRVTDDDGGIGLASVFVPVPLAAGSEGPGADALAPGQIAPLAAQAASLWLEAGADIAPLAGIVFEVVDLPGALLALVSVEGTTTRLTLDLDAAGHGWFVDSTPVFSEEFATVLSAEARYAATGTAAGRMDLLTVLSHEFGHVLGLAHVDPLISTQSVMGESLPLGMRRQPVTVDLTRALGGLLINGSFSIADPAFYEYGWQAGGSASISSGAGVLAEDSLHTSRLTQVFKLPPGATSMRFTITGGAMSGVTGVPPDAFEVALLDPDTMQPLSGTIALDGSDAFLNLQSTGALYRTAAVTVTDLQGNALSVIDFSQPVVVTLDLSGIASGARAALYFDLLGFGALDSSVQIDDVRFVGADTVNAAPVARDDSATVAEDGSLLLDPLANDSDPDGDFISVVEVGAASHGTVTIEAGQVRYVPAADYFGADSFSYTIADSAGQVAGATVSLIVEPVNDAPELASIPDYTLVEGVAFAVTVAATDPEGDELSFRLDQAPEGATIDAGTGEVHWTAAGAGTSVSFTVTVDDGQAQASRSFDVEVLAPGGANQPPVAAADSATMSSGYSLLVDVLANDLDPEGGALQLVAVTQPGHGTTAIEAGQVRYRPEAGFTGSDSFSYTVADSEGAEGTALVTVAVQVVVPPNLPPLAVDDSLELAEDDSLLIDVLANDSDPDGDALVLLDVSAALHGTASLEGGQLRYTPSPDYHGSEELVVLIGDGRGGEATARVLVTVTPVNDAPVAAADLANVAEDGSVLIDVLANDGDVDGDALTLAAVGVPAHGTAVIEDGRIRYTPAADYHGADSFSYEIRDPGGLTAGATVSVTVSAVNDPPTLAPVADARLSSGELFSLQLQGSDADGDALSWQLLTGPEGAALDASGLLTWTVAGPGTDVQFVVAVRDAQGAEASRGFVVTVRPLPVEAPLAAPRPNEFTFMPQPVEVPVLRFGSGFQALSGAPGPAMPQVLDEGAGRIVRKVRLEPGAEPISVRQPAGRDPRLVLRVERFQPTADGFAVRFSERVLALVLEAGRDGTQAGAPEVLVLGPDGRPLVGSILMDADGRGFRFVAAGGRLAAGAYQVVLRSGLDGFYSFFGLLDGDGDGVPGGDYRQGFEIEPEARAAQAGAAEAPAIDFGRSYAGFALVGTLAFGAVARSVAPRDEEPPPLNTSLRIRLQ
jgi:hypothetical protein